MTVPVAVDTEERRMALGAALAVAARAAHRPPLPPEPARSPHRLAQHHDLHRRRRGRRHGADRGARRDERPPGRSARADPGGQPPPPDPHLRRRAPAGRLAQGALDDRAEASPASSRRRRKCISQAGITAGSRLRRRGGRGRLRSGHRLARRSPRFRQSITKGDLSLRPTKPGVDGGILLGSRLASRLSVYPGDIVSLVPVRRPR